MSLFFISILITISIMIIGSMIKKKNIFKKEKNSPFECGFDPFSIARQPFSLRFFSISIIFLIFDIEIIILLPFPLLNNLINMNLILSLSFLITMIMIGLFYEWKNGMIQWL
uniref:NADH dehydrogenase subunit 3 n=1 Tax=Alectorobius puertoricensis TaxID=48824 RepID=UPI002237FDC8|nr:NADH dehydrogenase subunit 3 [Alectorobius puertoricensis]UYB78541.1 NADH dehydrogenase subunit 3 [Alectorobius puertoricensis]UYB78554.1 NADH dehydrogenase subunit 3 [Alectorobius puertoricensis]